MTPEALERAITPKTKWVMLNSPSNPTGAAYTRDELKALTDVLVRHPHVWVMTDDMYEHLVYDDFEFSTPGAGRAAALRPHADGERRVQGLLHDRLAHRLCRRARAADQGDGDDPVAVDLEPDRGVAMGGGRGARRAAGLHRRSTTRSSRSGATSCVSMLNQANGIHCPKPEGAFYVYPSCAGTIGQDGAERARSSRPTRISSPSCWRPRASRWCRARRSASGRPSASPTRPRPTDVEEACRRIQRFCGNLQ